MNDNFKKAKKYYSFFNFTLKKPKKMIVFLCDGKYSHGGFADRLKGIISLFAFALVKNVPFKIVYNFPFQLNDYLLENQYDWLPKKEKISSNFFQTKYFCLIDKCSADDLLTIKKIRKQTHFHANMDYLEQINSVFGTNFDFATLFHILFNPTKELSDLLMFHKTQMGQQYISAHFRFIGLLGDFKDNRNNELAENEKETLIKRNLLVINDLAQKFPNQKIFVAADSEIFIKQAKTIDNVYVLDGNILHIDKTKGEKSAYLRVFLDFFLISESTKVFSICSSEMYASQFPIYAAKINNVEFEKIII